MRYVPTMYERITEVFESDSNSTNVRAMIYSCSVELAKDHWLTGVSVERLQFYLNICYTQFGDIEGRLMPKFNTHNEYLNLICGKGILALSSFVILLVALFKKAIRQPDFLSFCILFALVCLTENLLERQIGVFFFTLIGGLYGICLYKKDSEHDHRPS